MNTRSSKSNKGRARKPPSYRRAIAARASGAESKAVVPATPPRPLMAPPVAMHLLAQAAVKADAAMRMESAVAATAAAAPVPVPVPVPVPAPVPEALTSWDASSDDPAPAEVSEKFASTIPLELEYEQKIGWVRDRHNDPTANSIRWLLHPMGRDSWVERVKVLDARVDALFCLVVNERNRIFKARRCWLSIITPQSLAPANGHSAHTRLFQIVSQ